MGKNEVKPIYVKMKAISDFPVPSCRKQLMSFLGIAGYYRRFCHTFSIIAEPLTNLSNKKSKLVCFGKCQQAFNKLKVTLKNTPVLLAPDFNKS